MKKLKLIFLFLIAFSLAGNTQGKAGFGFYTDRDVYVSGETLLAKIFVPSENLSGIAHLDLVNKGGVRISGASIEIKNKQANGCLYLPDSLSSGTYLLRAYLRNNANECKIIHEIWIADRFEGLEKTKEISQVANIVQLPAQNNNEISLDGLADEVKTNLAIQAQVKLDENLLQKLDGNLLISVARIIPEFESATFQQSSPNPNPGLTESKGIIFSGTVTDKKTKNPVSNATVYLTIPDSIPGFQYYNTGNDGRFYFLIDKYYGDIQAIIQCFPKEPLQRLKMTLDEPYAAIGTMPEFIAKPVSEEFRNEIAKSIDAMTFQKIFAQETISKLAMPAKKSDDYPYYGIPSNVVDPQLFIDLPNFNEISKELLPGVKFRNHNNEPTMQVINSPLRNFFNEQPLILLDGIPIRDLNLIKDMGTTDIDRVDICQSERFYGDLKFPGVVAIYSAKSDYSKLVDNDQLVKINTEAKQIPVQLITPVAAESSVPDLRQVLYFDANAEPARTIAINFGTSNIQGHFKMIVRGRTTDGTLIFAEKQFEVK